MNISPISIRGGKKLLEICGINKSTLHTAEMKELYYNSKERQLLGQIAIQKAIDYELFYHLPIRMSEK